MEGALFTQAAQNVRQRPALGTISSECGAVMVAVRVQKHVTLRKTVAPTLVRARRVCRPALVMLPVQLGSDVLPTTASARTKAFWASLVEAMESVIPAPVSMASAVRVIVAVPVRHALETRRERVMAPVHRLSRGQIPTMSVAEKLSQPVDKPVSVTARGLARFIRHQPPVEVPIVAVTHALR